MAVLDEAKIAIRETIRDLAGSGPSADWLAVPFDAAKRLYRSQNAFLSCEESLQEVGRAARTMEMAGELELPASFGQCWKLLK
jgi:hypothetical protein